MFLLKRFSFFSWNRLWIVHKLIDCVLLGNKAFQLAVTASKGTLNCMQIEQMQYLVISVMGNVLRT